MFGPAHQDIVDLKQKSSSGSGGLVQGQKSEDQAAMG